MSTNRSTQKLQRRALRKKKGASAFQYFLLILGTVVILLPMYLTVVTAFKSPEESARNFFAPPTSLYLDNIISVVNKANFFYYIRNSFVITLFSLLGIILIVAFVPFTILMVPQIKLMSILGMLNNFGLILLYWVYSLSEGTLLTVSFVQSGIPYELEESAYMDGANVFCTYRHIVLPLMRPIISTVVIMDTLWIWNDFQLPLLMLNRSQTMWTLPLFQYNFQSKYTVAYNQAFAAFLLSMVPMLIFYIVCQKQIIGGLTAGAVKG